jgi:chaperonin cofactor prefoldin
MVAKVQAEHSLEELSSAVGQLSKLIMSIGFTKQQIMELNTVYDSLSLIQEEV